MCTSHHHDWQGVLLKQRKGTTKKSLQKKKKKFPPIVLENKRQLLVDRLEDKRGFSLYQPSWQEKLAKRRHTNEMRKYDISRPMDNLTMFEVVRHKLVQVVSQKPWEFIGS